MKAWRFCAGSHNPADLPPCGISGKDLSNEILWFNGPEFLLQNEHDWRKCPSTNQTVNDVLKEIVKGPVNVVRALVIADDAKSPKINVNNIIDISRFNSLTKLIRLTAYALRFVKVLKESRLLEKPPEKQELTRVTTSEIGRAETIWIKSMQGAVPSVSPNMKSAVPVYIKQ